MSEEEGFVKGLIAGACVSALFFVSYYIEKRRDEARCLKKQRRDEIKEIISRLEE